MILNFDFKCIFLTLDSKSWGLHEKHFFLYESACANLFQLRMQKHAKNRLKPNSNPKWGKNYPLFILTNTFHGCHLETFNQKEIGAIDHIFQFYLVRSAEVATIKSVWKYEQNFPNFWQFLGVSVSCFLVKTWRKKSFSKS